MLYIPCMKVGQNDVKALINLEDARKELVSPLLNMRGIERHLNDFLADWGDYAYLMDISRSALDIANDVIGERDLHNPNNHFENKRNWFVEVKAKNSSLIPVVSWLDTDNARDIIQQARLLLAEFDTIAIRVACPSEIAGPSWDRAMSILDAIPDPENILVILDFGDRSPISTINGGTLDHSLSALDNYEVYGVALVSSSFPSQKPQSGSSSTALCHDIVWQAEARQLNDSINLIYGDYAGTNPGAAVEYIQGMAVIPFASYYVPNEWWLKRLGRDKEFENYVQLAREIRQLPDYHGDDFCWATREYGRISQTNERYGNNGVWNGFRANQHICATLQFLQYEDDGDILSIDDML
ncbi:hypothetical protein C1Y08_26495 [Pseudomonas sp. FW306-02-F02-AA]|uniref:T4 beta protein n=1 Tax=Pseudomonas fluorescens TaxID=294 RepID=A0A0N9VYW9_PSEFL|nr:MULTISPECIES: hypothetical protein [Pseudomonas]ALI03856.1 hypothetical protein AO353_23330 [Pseudomonas fluorescens]PMZ02967.1 hypothetical protein C1Y07_16625 [Pseudomonas sp. FW306-02-F02-AB]PMZ11946.1 hypothetical protein C1Y06_00595 [Pseudomonas sp. FW306-02-H06C]PMZ12954.1 hypothetical protein C1Y08_26495 [Pseudomonas sp. FW306-02-F02-AA]PMZ20418.1 hypothetical protein C1Y09_18400 [Pseudomonas sp. FW306-02-F08-AA]